MLKTLSNCLKKNVFKNDAKTLKLVTSFYCSKPVRLNSFRTSENDPDQHSSGQLGQFYTIPAKEKGIFQHGGIPKAFQIQSNTFNETCLMVREPALEVINYLKKVDYTKPAIRFVLYGPIGSGKTLSLAHVLHYAHKKGFLLVHVPWVSNWMRRPKEFSNSDTKEGRIDLNLDAAAWLVHFKTQNATLLASLSTTEEHIWTKREKTEKGAPILQLIDHGINRVKFASDCVLALAKEIKTLSSSGKCKTLVAIDGFNAFFYPRTRIYTEKKEKVHPLKLTLTEAFLDLTLFNWHNAAIVVTVDQMAVDDKGRESILPRYLLQKEGFEHLDPFIPVKVDNYSEKELMSCMNYYRERKWVREVDGQDQELAFLSNYNPYELMRVCSSL